MRRAHRTLRHVMSVVATVVVIGWGAAAWTGRAGVAAREAGQTQTPSAAPTAREAAAMKLTKESIVVDGHVHLETSVFHQGLDPWQVQPTGLFDYARAKQGGLNVVVHAVYTEDAYFNYNYGVKHALRLIETFYRVLDANQDKMELALTSADVRRIVAKGKMAAILALEGNPDTEGDLDVLRMWYRLGVRMIQLTSHDTTNVLIDAQQDEHKWGGVSDRGRAFIREMNRLGIIVDPSHSSEAAHLQAIAASLAPVVTTHSGLAQFAGGTGSMRLSDEMFKALVAKGGLLALIQSSVISKPWADWHLANPQPRRFGPDASGTFVSGGRRVTLGLPSKGIRPPDKDYGAYITALDAEMDDGWVREQTADRRGTGYGTPWRVQQAKLIEAGVPLPTPADWVEHAAYAMKLGGEDHVAIGLDLMAQPTMRDFDASQYWRFTEAMLAKGMSPTTIKKVLGENWLRMLDQAKVPGLTPPPASR